jgi:hypothetical protein
VACACDGALPAAAALVCISTSGVVFTRRCIDDDACVHRVACRGSAHCCLLSFVSQVTTGSSIIPHSEIVRDHITSVYLGQYRATLPVVHDSPLPVGPQLMDGGVVGLGAAGVGEGGVDRFEVNERCAVASHQVLLRALRVILHGYWRPTALAARVLPAHRALPRVRRVRSSRTRGSPHRRRCGCTLHSPSLIKGTSRAVRLVAKAAPAVMRAFARSPSSIILDS